MVSSILHSSVKQQEPKLRFISSLDKEMSSKKIMLVKNKFLKAEKGGLLTLKDFKTTSCVKQLGNKGASEMQGRQV